LIQSNQLQGNPYLRNRHLERKNLAKTRGLNPYKATYVNRGYSKGVLDETGKLRNFTSACSPLIYRGDQFSADYYDNAFVCGPEANLVKRYHINRENGVITADTTLQKQEFLVSKEEVFRPVNLHNGPDGAMYVVDMHRVVIQHRAFMTSYLKDLIIKSGMDKIPNGGRILRVTEKANAKETLGDYSNLKPTDWVALLQSPNPWKRITAQKTLIGKDAKNLTTAIEKIAQAEEIPLGQMHALWTLEGLGTLTYKLLIQIGTTTKNPQVLSQVILISKKILNENNVAHFLPVFEKALAGEAYDPKLQLAHTLGSFKNPATEKIWLALANTFAEDKIMSEALVSSTYERENFFANKIAKDLKNSQLDSMMMATLENKKEDKKHELKISMKDHSDDRTRGFELFITHCASCHGMDAKGIENLAPSIYESEYANGPVEHLGLILLNGLKGPITIHGKKYEGAAVMPGLRDNPAITDEAIRDIIIFIKNSFSSKNQKRPSKKLIPELREATKDRKDLFTEAELHAWPIEKK
jgi:mono/diheme cytochrome c family protein